MLSRKSKIAISVSAVILVGSTAGVFWKRSQNASERIVDVKRGPVVEAVYAIGTVESTQTFQAKAGIPSSISRLQAKEGRAIQKGEALVTLSEGSTIRSRFDGVVTKVNYKVGESVFAGNVILEVVDPTKFEIRILLDQRAALQVKRSQLVRLSFDGLRKKEFMGKVRSVYSTGTQFMVITDTDALPPEILPGMTADVSIEISRKPMASLIPLAAIRSGKVTRLRKGKRSQVDVKTGLLNQELVEIIEGDLIQGDQVVINMLK